MGFDSFTLVNNLPQQPVIEMGQQYRVAMYKQRRLLCVAMTRNVKPVKPILVLRSAATESRPTVIEK